MGKIVMCKNKVFSSPKWRKWTYRKSQHNGQNY